MMIQRNECTPFKHNMYSIRGILLLQLEVLPSGDSVAAPAPTWGISFRCGKGTALSYGPWADRQRDHLLHFFFPQDYQPMKVSTVSFFEQVAT